MNQIKVEAGRQWLAGRWLAAGVLVVGAAIAAVSVHAQGRHEHGMDGAPGGGMMMFGDGPPMMGRGIDRMLDGLHATDAQRAQIRQIAMAAAADMRAQHESGRALHDKALQLFTAPTVDAGAAEALRQQMLAQHDQASKRMLQAMLEISKVLTPEQRAKIGERMKERQAVMHDRMQRRQHDHEHAEHPSASAPQK